MTTDEATGGTGETSAVAPETTPTTVPTGVAADDTADTADTDAPAPTDDTADTAGTADTDAPAPTDETADTADTAGTDATTSGSATPPPPTAPGGVPARATAAPLPAPPAPAAPPSDPREFGRVDEDGTVWVRTSAGERQVGSYPGASPDEALAYFGRKFDDLRAQVVLLEQRIRATDVAAKDVTSSVRRLRETVVTANAVGDLDGLVARLDALEQVADERRAQADAARSKAREEARATKERIVAEAEQLATSTQWKVTGDRLRALLDEWKRVGRLDRKTDDELWKRFSTARTTFDKHRRQHFATLDAQRKEARERKERLVAEAEELSSSTDWGPTAQRYRELMQEWKAAGRAGRDEEEALWQRFRGAQDAFFGARSAVFAERDAGLRENLERKEALVVEAEALLPVTDLTAAKRALRSIHERWEAIGHVPRADRERVESRLRRVEQAVRSAEETEWRRTNPEARARAEATVAQLRTSIATLEDKLAKARAAGRDKDASDTEQALEVRRSWLAEAERTLADLTR